MHSHTRGIARLLAIGLLAQTFALAHAESLGRIADPDPRAVLQRCDAALRKVERIDYLARCYFGDPDRGVPAAAEVKVCQWRRPGRTPGFLAEQTNFSTNLVPETKKTISYNGRTLEVVDHYRHIVHEGRLADAAASASSFLSVLMMRDLTSGAPMAEALRALRVTSPGRTKIGADECDIIDVLTRDGRQVRWWIRVSDAMPRRRYDQNSNITHDILSLEASEKCDTGLPTPEGYTRVRDRGLPEVTYAEEGDPLPAFVCGVEDRAFARKLRDVYKLDELIAEATTDLDRVRLICDWVHSQWQHSNTPTKPLTNTIDIIEAGRQGERFSCSEYASVVTACLNAVGISAREVILMHPEVDTMLLGSSHVVAEAYLRDLGKWVFVDAQKNVVPTLDDRPLNTVEFQRALQKRDPALDLSIDGEITSYPLELSESMYFLRARLESVVLANPRFTGAAMLVPDGATAPKAFQRVSPIQGDAITTSLKAFYAPPDVRR
ncbi:MAG: transglutaminase-like domain-containing protein [Phycisphaerales bacterium]|nr:transglutaminase-like domain-containing protein [Phycisphaerales bacterium]